MKKRIIGLITTVSFIAVLCGCNKSGPQYSESDSDIFGVDSKTSGDKSGVDSNTSSGDAPVFEDLVGEYPENSLPIMTLSEEEIRQAVNAQPNFQCSENVYINLPESASVYEFRTYGVHVPQFDYPADVYRRDYEESFKYFFPDREMNMDYLKYYKYIGYDYENMDYIADEGYVKDREDLPDQVEFTYDETPERPTTWNDPVYMYLNIEIGCGSGEINKGEAVGLAGKREYDDMGEKTVASDTYNKLRGFELFDFFESVGKYSPKCEKSFNLLDGEMRICDAVEFVENYINNAPISTGHQRNLCMRVYSVYVVQLDENTYGYYFQTQPEFQGVRYEPGIGGSHREYGYDYSGCMGYAYMIRSDEVDYIRSIYACAWTFDVKPCDKIISVDTVVKSISEKLTEGVTFDVLSVEFVYAQQYEKDEKGHIIIDTYEAHVKPVWRITLGNSNDDLTYICYVDAKDGGNFVYYTVPGIRGFD